MRAYNLVWQAAPMQTSKSCRACFLFCFSRYIFTEMPSMSGPPPPRLLTPFKTQWSLIRPTAIYRSLTNQSPVFRSRDPPWPIRGQYLCPVTLAAILQLVDISNIGPARPGLMIIDNNPSLQPIVLSIFPINIIATRVHTFTLNIHCQCVFCPG